MTDCRRVGTRIVVSRTAILPVDEGIVTMQWLLENFGVAPPAGNGRTYANCSSLGAVQHLLDESRSRQQR